MSGGRLVGSFCVGCISVGYFGPDTKSVSGLRVEMVPGLDFDEESNRSGSGSLSGVVGELRRLCELRVVRERRGIVRVVKGYVDGSLIVVGVDGMQRMMDDVDDLIRLEGLMREQVMRLECHRGELSIDVEMRKFLLS